MPWYVTAVLMTVVGQHMPIQSQDHDACILDLSVSPLDVGHRVPIDVGQCLPNPSQGRDALIRDLAAPVQIYRRQ